MSAHGPWNPHPGRTPDDDDMDALSQLGMARAAGAATAVAGLSTVLSSLQTWLMVRFAGVLVAAPWLVLAMGVFAIYLGAKLAGAHRWAAVATVAYAGVLFVVTTGWAITTYLLHFTAFFLLLSPVASITSLVLAVVAIPTCDRAERARARLAQQGIELGV